MLDQYKPMLDIIWYKSNILIDHIESDLILDISDDDIDRVYGVVDGLFSEYIINMYIDNRSTESIEHVLSDRVLLLDRLLKKIEK